MNYDLILRMNSNKASIQKSFLSLMESIQKDSKENIYISSSELLYWIINTNDLLNAKFRKRYRDSKTKEIKGILLGLRFAFNANKHNMNIFGLNNEKIRELPIINFKEILWADFSSYKPKEDQIKAYNAYITYLQNDVVLGTFGIAKTFLIEQIENLKKDVI